jgi:hypothetical protein
MFPLMSADLSPYLYQPTALSLQPQLCTQEDCSWRPLLEAVRNEKLKFREQEIAVKPWTKDVKPIRHAMPGIPKFDIKIIIENPPELVQLSNVNDIRIFDELLRLLNYPDRAWAANILLGKLMGLPPISIEVEVLHSLALRRDGSLNYDSKRVSPVKWWETEGKTLHAKKAWITYLRKVKPTMKWHREEVAGHDYFYFRHITPDGRKVI